MTNILDDFLSYKPGSTGARATLLKWKEDGKIDIWLHTQVAPLRLWRHGFPRLVSYKSKEGVEMNEIWNDNILSLEDEVTNKNRHKRSRVSGNRDLPPRFDPLDRFVEFVRAQEREGKIFWLDEAFRWETETDEKILHVAGLWNFVKNPTDTQKAELRKAKIDLREAWKENVDPRLQWVFVVADHNKAENGLQVSLETQSLGEKVQTLIHNEMTGAKYPDLGNPILHPYSIRWTYSDDPSLPYGDRYEAIRIQRNELTPEIETLIMETDPPDTSYLFNRPNLDSLRTNMETHCLLQGVPWDEIFKPAYKLYKDNGWNTSGEETKNNSNPEPTTPEVSTKNYTSNQFTQEVTRPTYLEFPDRKTDDLPF